MNNKQITFEKIIVHAVEIPQQSNKIKLFNETDKNETSVTEITEYEIVEWIFKQPQLLDLITKNVCNVSSKDVFFKLQVKEPFLSLKQQKEIIGDIDAIIIPKQNPEKTIAIEFKRIKVVTLEDKNVKVNKVETIKKKGFSQVSKLNKLGFSKTYLGIIIEDDARNVESANTIIRNSDFFDILDINKDDELNSNSGLFFIELVQPTGEFFKSRFNMGIYVDKEAKEYQQSDILTNKIRKIMK